MRIKAIKGAPQLTRLLRELPPSTVERLIEARPFSAALQLPDSKQGKSELDIRIAASKAFSDLLNDDLVLYEQEAARITRLDNHRADALHLRLADSVDRGSRRDLEELPGALARSAESFCKTLFLFRSVERAMQLRSYRENGRIYEAHDLQTPISLDVDEIDTVAFARRIADRLELAGGCSVEAVELPKTEQADREIMLAVVSGGALASQKTFEPEIGLDSIQFRPATEVIMIYRPWQGTIEICGRDWSDRSAIVRLFASDILREELSERPLTQRNYDLRPLVKNLAPGIPAELADRISELYITEVRYALGDYDRKITVTALAGEPIADIAKNALRGVGTRNGQPFLCDAEFFLRLAPHDGRVQTLRFKVTNQNRSTLQSEPDPDKRKIGFDLLQALGIVRSFSEPNREDVTSLFPTLVELMAHERDEIGWTELREIHADVSRLTNSGFLKQRTIAAEVLIEDDSIGPVEMSVVADPSTKTALLGLTPDGPFRRQDLDPLLIWQINRGFVREKVLHRLKALALNRQPLELGHGLLALGTSTICGDRRPVFSWEGGSNLKTIEKINRVLRNRNDASPGLVLKFGARPVDFLGKHLVLEMQALFDGEDADLDLARLEQLWKGARFGPEKPNDIELDILGECAVLRINGEAPWTIVGAQRVKLVRLLHAAWKEGKAGLETGELIRHTKSTSPQAVLGPDWKPLIVDRYIHSPKYGLWSLKVPSA